MKLKKAPDITSKITSFSPSNSKPMKPMVQYPAGYDDRFND